MASHSVTGTYSPLGVNHGNQFYIQAVLTEALAAANTLTVSLPSTVPFGALPCGVAVWAVAGAACTWDGVDLPMTAATHNTSTGVTVLTATGDVAAGTKVLLSYIGV